MSGAVGNVVGLSVAGIVSAAAGAEEVSAGCIGSLILLCLAVNRECEASSVTTWLAFPLVGTLFIGVVAADPGTTFLVANSLALATAVGVLYAAPR